MFFWNKFCGQIIIFLFSSVFSYAQHPPQLPSAKINISLKNNYLSINSANSPFSELFFENFHQRKSESLLYKNLSVHAVKIFNRYASPIIPVDFATCDYGFFCRQELGIEKATKFPIRFRLGSLEQCNYYEGKH